MIFDNPPNVAPCEWARPCNQPECARCTRRIRFQQAKLERFDAAHAAVPLSVLKAMHPPPIDVGTLSEAGPFLILRGYVRPALDADGRGEQVVYQVEPLRGQLAGIPYVLTLTAFDFRVQIVDLLRRTGAPVGPCVLLLRYLDPTAGMWSICALAPDGELWDPFGMVPDDPPAPGAPPVPCW